MHWRNEQTLFHFLVQRVPVMKRKVRDYGVVYIYLRYYGQPFRVLKYMLHVDELQHVDMNCQLVLVCHHIIHSN